MATSHHGEPPREVAQEFEALQRDNARQGRLIDQFFQQDRPNHSEGKITEDDQGDLAFAIAADKENGIVRIEFGKPVDWLGMPPKQAVELAQMLIRTARDISPEPLRVSLY